MINLKITINHICSKYVVLKYNRTNINIMEGTLDGLAFEWLCPRDRVHMCDERYNRQKNRLISGVGLDLQ
jgi:hypothetical protein